MTHPYYREINDERNSFKLARERKLPVLLKGPTGCGKTRFVEAMAAELGLNLVAVVCNEDTSAADLLGRHLIKGGDTVWQDGPVTRAVREGALLYLDEVAEAREDVIVVLHSLTDDRRQLHLDRINEVVTAAPGFCLVASFNPGYQSRLKELKPSTRQRFITLSFNYPEPPIEAEIIAKETQASTDTCKKLVTLATQIRSLKELGLRETVSTRLLVHAAHLIHASMPARRACEIAIVQVLTDDSEITQALTDLVALKF